GSPCDMYEFDVHINNSDLADAEDITFDLSMLEGMNIVTSTYSIGNNPPVSISSTMSCSADTCNYAFDLNTEAYNGSGMPSGSVIILHLGVTGDCFLHGTEPELEFHSLAYDI